MKGKFLALIIVILSQLACRKSEPARTQQNLPEQVIHDLAYGADPAQKMDIYLPGGRSSSGTKVMILVHGGGWTSGDKGELNFHIDQLRSRLKDYAFINVNYRLYNGTINRFPTQENDVRSSVEFILSKRSDFNISDNIVLLGTSAGAHLALLHGFKYSNPVKVKAVISFYGPTDLAAFYNNPPSAGLQPSLAALLGCTPSENLTAYQQSSPSFFVTQFSPPVLLLHGDKDVMVPVAQSILLKNKLDASGVISKLVIYPYEGHGWTGASLENSFEEITNFLSSNVK